MNFKLFTDFVEKKLYRIDGITAKVKRGICFINITLYYKERNIKIYVRKYQYKALVQILKSNPTYNIMLEAFEYFLVESAIDFKYGKQEVKL